ncbi:MAG TPA: hypothetical protein VFE62_15040 [Gemmataceae bacterium]|nr:hypothetical protein [Gemmataceae bacterium]
MHSIEVFVMIDSAGDYVIAKDRDELADAWDNDIGGTPVGARVLALSLAVDTSDTQLAATVPADARQATLTVKPE